MKNTTFFIKTLGCKVNQIESAYIIESLLEKVFLFLQKKKLKF